MTSADRDGLEQELERFIVGELLEQEEAELYNGRDPLAGGAVDSLGYEQLVHYIEEELGVGLRDEEMVEENFESIPVLAAFIDSKRGGATV